MIFAKIEHGQNNFRFCMLVCLGALNNAPSFFFSLGFVLSLRYQVCKKHWLSSQQHLVFKAKQKIVFLLLNDVTSEASHQPLVAQVIRVQLSVVFLKKKKHFFNISILAQGFKVVHGHQAFTFCCEMGLTQRRPFFPCEFLLFFLKPKH